QLQQIGIAEADELSQGRLVAMGARPAGTLALYGLLLRGLFSRLGDADHVFSFGFDRLTVRARGRSRRVKVALDGEICWLDTPLHFRVSPQPLRLLVPPEALRAESAGRGRCTFPIPIAAPKTPRPSAHCSRWRGRCSPNWCCWGATSRSAPGAPSSRRPAILYRICNARCWPCRAITTFRYTTWRRACSTLTGAFGGRW